MKLPAPLNFGWKMKPVESARTSFERMSRDVFDLRIEHDLLRGITPRMLYWWFTHIGGNMTWQGQEYSRYRVWHPLDHIHWELARPAEGGGAGAGASFRIVEAFGRNPRHTVDSVEYVEKLDETGIRLTRKIAGRQVFSLEHWFEAAGENTRYRSRMIVGAEAFPHNLLFNKIVRPFIFSEEMGHAWLKHNVEEVGNFEFFLPELFLEESARQEH
jgi:hypothetical protein